MKIISISFLGLLLMLGFQAQAHTSLAASTPADGEILEAAPEQVLLEFDEDVRLVQFAIQDGQGNQVSTDFEMSRVESSQFEIAVTQNLNEHSYIVNWMVMSADGHRVSGAVNFEIIE